MRKQTKYFVMVGMECYTQKEKKRSYSCAYGRVLIRFRSAALFPTLRTLSPKSDANCLFAFASPVTAPK